LIDLEHWILFMGDAPVCISQLRNVHYCSSMPENEIQEFAEKSSSRVGSSGTVICVHFVYSVGIFLCSKKCHASALSIDAATFSNSQNHLKITC
jgi:hypothetical protein